MYCGQTVELIKLKLGTEVGLGLGHFVLDGDPATPKRDTAPSQLSAYVRCGQTAGWIKMPLGTQDVGLGPGDTALDGDPAAPPQNGDSSPHFSAHV